jgi:hypothetical protein
LGEDPPILAWFRHRRAGDANAFNPTPACAAGHQGSKDPSLFSSRMPGFFIYNYQELGYSQYTFHTRPGKNIEGRYVKLQYDLK